MDKQQSDHIDNIIRQAAENIPVPFKEEAWEKMELLLDKDLHKDRRPAAIWWWMLLLLCILGGSGYYFFSYRQSGSNRTAQTAQQNVPLRVNGSDQKNQDGLSDKDQQGTTGKHAGSSASKEMVNRESRSITSIPEQQQPVNKALNSSNTNKMVPEAGGNTSISAPVSLSKEARTSGNRSGIRGSLATRKSAYPSSHPVNGKVKKHTSAVSSNTIIPGVQEEVAHDKQPADKQAIAIAPAALPVEKQEGTVKSDSASSVPNNSTTDKPAAVARKQKAPVELSGAKKTTGFYYLASVARNATDVRTLTLNNLGYVFGAGVGYQLNSRLISIQTGFYAGRRIYKAGPDDYHTKQGSLYNVSIKTVNANCYIIDIPLTVRYDVIHKRTFHVYGTAGISSFIMKKENYVYHYNDVYGRYGMLDSTYRGNVNFLSAVNVSIGVEKMIVKGFYLQAEPYIKMPFSGIGEGKVKLYDAGFQLGIRYQPFKKSKAH